MQSLEPLLAQAGWLRRFARALIRDDDVADEVVQRTLITAWRRPPADPQRNPRGWFARTATHRSRDLARAQRRRADWEAAAELTSEDGAASPEQLILDVELHRAIAAAVAELPAPLREVITRRYFDGLTAAEIARELDVPAGTVRWRLKEGLDRVRRRLDQRYGERARWQVALAALVPARASKRPSGPLPASVFVLVGAVVMAVGAGVLLRPRHAAAPAPSRSGQAAVASPAVVRRGPRFVERAPHQIGVAEPGGSEVDADAWARRLLDAVAVGSYDDFAAHAGDELTAHVSKTAFDDSSASLGPGLRRGYVLERLGTLQRDGGVMHVWRLAPADGGDEHLVRMTVQRSAAVAFLIE